MVNTGAFAVLVTQTLCECHVGQRDAVIIACPIRNRFRKYDTIKLPSSLGNDNLFSSNLAC